MIVEIQLKENSQRLQHTDVEVTYQKGSFYCIYDRSEATTYKYPIEDIWRVKERHELSTATRSAASETLQTEGGAKETG